MGSGSFGVWHVVFMLGGYTSILVCLYAAYRIGQAEGWQWGVAQLLILAVFLLLYWLLESWAGVRTPYFWYPPPPAGFPDWVGFFPWDRPPWNVPIGGNDCQITIPENDGIPFSVLALEATLTYSAMHTALLLARDWQYRLLRPFMAAVPLLALDFLLDPVSSQSFLCLAGDGMASDGLRFWEWYVLPRLGPDAFSIPLFNYAVWYSAPLVMIALIGLIGWFHDLVFMPIRLLATQPYLIVVFVIEGAFLAIIIFAFSVIIMMSPNFAGIPIAYLRLIFIGILVNSVLMVLAFVKFFKYDNDFRWWFVYPQAAFLLYSGVSLVASGQLASEPALALVALIVAPLFLLWTLSPYLKKIWP
jgi:hypothetical protein